METQKSYKFSEINYDILHEITGVELVRDDSIFKEWFNFSYKITDSENEFFVKLIKAHKYNIKDYVEYQLLAHFISPLLNWIYFFGDNFREWYLPEISGIVNGYKLYGKPDFVVASGSERPDKPYFFIQEFKKQKTNSDPLRQVIAQMAVAIEINKTKEIKGAYNIGKWWNFVIVKKISEKKYQYYESESFNSLKISDLKQIYINLQAVKHKYCK